MRHKHKRVCTESQDTSSVQDVLDQIDAQQGTLINVSSSTIDVYRDGKAMIVTDVFYTLKSSLMSDLIEGAITDNTINSSFKKVYDRVKGKAKVLGLPIDSDSIIHDIEEMLGDFGKYRDSTSDEILDSSKPK